jgi:hypothetical protein
MWSQADNEFVGMDFGDVLRPPHVLIQKPFTEFSHDAE